MQVAMMDNALGGQYANKPDQPWRVAKPHFFQGFRGDDAGEETQADPDSGQQQTETGQATFQSAEENTAEAQEAAAEDDGSSGMTKEDWLALGHDAAQLGMSVAQYLTVQQANANKAAAQAAAQGNSAATAAAQAQAAKIAAAKATADKAASKLDGTKMLVYGALGLGALYLLFGRK